MKKLINLVVCLLPWGVRRQVLSRFYGYRIAPTARIGLSYIYPRHLIMEEGARISHLNVVQGLEELSMGEKASIGRLNWISAFPKGLSSRHFINETNRDPRLEIGAHSAITNRHLIDCSNRVKIGAYSTFAGFRSQILTHSIDLYSCLQVTNPVEVGAYCFVGTASILLPGAQLPDRSVLAAGSVLTGPVVKTDGIYGGVPAKLIKPVSVDAAYFKRTEGYVW